jgi:hypothetical protein
VRLAFPGWDSGDRDLIDHFVLGKFFVGDLLHYRDGNLLEMCLDLFHFQFLTLHCYPNPSSLETIRVISFENRIPAFSFGKLLNLRLFLVFPLSLGDVAKVLCPYC